MYHKIRWEMFLLRYKQNLHIHSTYVDGKDTPEEMVLEAISKGFDSIGFSEHSYLPYSPRSSRFTEAQAKRYAEEVHDLKRKYQDQVQIFCGLEYDFYSNMDTASFDYLIGSVHYLDCGGQIVSFDKGLPETIDYIRAYFDCDALAFAKKYYETVARLPEKASFDILGHFDLITKNNETGKFLDVSSKEYLGIGFETIHALKGKIPFFEVNTGSLARGYRTTPYPQLEFLREFRQQGFGVVITSDCHDKNFIDFFYPDAEALIRAAGFETKWILTESGFREVTL